MADSLMRWWSTGQIRIHTGRDVVGDRNSDYSRIWRRNTGVIPQSSEPTFRAQPVLGISVCVRIAAEYLSACLALMKFLVEQTTNPRFSAGI